VKLLRLGRQHVRDDIATIKTEKSGFAIEVTLPILPVLESTLKVGPCGDLTFIVGESGHPLTKESFGNLFRTPVGRLAFRVARTAFARLRLRGRQTLGPPSHSSRRSSAGKGAVWLRSIPALPTVAA